MMDARVLSRSFSYNGVKLPDPDPGMTPEEVKAAYSHQYRELATAQSRGRNRVESSCNTASSERLARKGDCIDNVRTNKYIHCAHNWEATMRGAGTKAEKTRGENINLRVSRGQKSLIDRAAHALGRNRSDFMLETACREAESILLDRRYFILPEEQFKRFTAMLDKPPASNPRLARLLKTRAPWDK